MVPIWHAYAKAWAQDSEKETSPENFAALKKVQHTTESVGEPIENGGVDLYDINQNA